MADFYSHDRWDDLVRLAFQRHPATRHQQETLVMPSQPILGSLDHLKQQQARLDARIAEIEARLNQYGEDVYSPGAVLAWDKQFASGGTTYSYAALKTPIGWFITGRDSSTALSWSGLIDNITKDAVALPILYSVTEMEEVMP
jgi:hypothetical protein